MIFLKQATTALNLKVGFKNIPQKNVLKWKSNEKGVYVICIYSVWVCFFVVNRAPVQSTPPPGIVEVDGEKFTTQW